MSHSSSCKRSPAELIKDGRVHSDLNQVTYRGHPKPKIASDVIIIRVERGFLSCSRARKDLLFLSRCVILIRTL